MWSEAAARRDDEVAPLPGARGLVQDALSRSAGRFPGRTALVCGETRLSYAQLDEQASRLAGALAAEGVQPGSRVVVLLENSAESVVSIYAILRAGAVFTLLSPSTKAEKLGYVLADEVATALITVNDPVRRRTVANLAPELVPPLTIWVGGVPAGGAGGRQRGWEELGAAAAGPVPDLLLSDDAIGTIIYTSGTTGAPKGVVSLHRDMVFSVASINAYLHNSPSDVIFCSLSLAFTYGLYQLLTAVEAGSTLVLERNFTFPRRALEVMQRERVTALPGVPMLFRLLLGVERLDHFDLSSLRYLTNAAAPMPVEQIMAVRDTFPHAEFFSMYGQTECKRTCYLPPEELARRPGSVGVAIPGTEAYVVDANGEKVPPGTVGELVVAGPHLMARYWQKPEETAQRLRTGADGRVVMYSGDLFRTDDDGFLYFVSRADDMIKTRGEKVSPNEIEAALRRLEGVRDVAAVGVPDDLLGEAVAVFVVRAPGSLLTERAVRAFCREHLEEFIVPRYVEFRRELPTSENGKTVRKELRRCVG